MSDGPLEPADSSEVAELTEALRLARRELKLSRGRQEAAEETLQQVRRQRAALREQARLCSEVLARVLSERYWAEQRRGIPGRLANRLLPGHDDADERDLVATIEASDLFDGAWYLRRYPDAARALLSPAVHYLRTGAGEGAEPGPRFDTEQYLADHPGARDSGLPPLVHHDRRREGS